MDAAEVDSQIMAPDFFVSDGLRPAAGVRPTTTVRSRTVFPESPATMQIQEVVTAPRSPRQNAYGSGLLEVETEKQSDV